MIRLNTSHPAFDLARELLATLPPARHGCERAYATLTDVRADLSLGKGVGVITGLRKVALSLGVRTNGWNTAGGQRVFGIEPDDFERAARLAGDYLDAVYADAA